MPKSLSFSSPPSTLSSTLKEPYLREGREVGSESAETGTGRGTFDSDRDSTLSQWWTKFSYLEGPRKSKNLPQIFSRNRYEGFIGSWLELVVQEKHCTELS